MNCRWMPHVSWEAIDVLLNLIELLIMCIPACVIFLYYRVRSLEIWPQEVTPYGTTIIIHNGTNKSIFITRINAFSKNSNPLLKPTVSFDKRVKQLKPDEYIEVTVDYATTSSKRESIKLTVYYNRRGKKTVRLRYNGRI